MKPDYINIEVTKWNTIPAQTLYGVGAAYDYILTITINNKQYHRYIMVECIANFRGE